MRKFAVGAIVGLLGLLIGLVFMPVSGAVGERGGGQLIGTNGQSLGQVTVVQEANGVKLTVNFNGIPAGQHGIHFHQVGKCDTPGFTTAGEHYNPTGKQHGTQNSAGAHAGDIDGNLTAPANGNGTFETTTNAVTLTAGNTTLFDSDGTALVIHANADDLRTDPSGNSGGRIACAVLTLNTANAPAGGVPAAGVGGGDATGGGSPLLIGLGLTLLAGAAGLLVVRRRVANR
jgi:superoxide dismutase, Cu-Zn family